MGLKLRKATEYLALTVQCTRTSLKSRIDALLEKANPLSMSPKEFFHDLFSIVAHLKVAGTQRDFPLETKFSALKGFKLNCTSLRGGKCPVYFLLEELDDGRFKLGNAELGHNHSINHLEIDDVIKGRIRDIKSNGEGNAGAMDDEYEMESFQSESSIEVTERNKFTSERLITLPSLIKSSAILQFRTYYNIKVDVARLVQGPKITLPTSENGISFKTHDEFRIQAVASAIQNDYLLHLDNVSFNSDPNRFRMKYSRNSSACTFTTRCGFYMDIIVDSIPDGDKVWKVTSETEHNQLCFKSRTGKVKYVPIASTSTLPTIKRSAAPLSPPTSHKHLQKRPRLSPPLITSTHSHPTQSSSKTSKSKRTIPTIHFTPISISQLSSFLYQLSPSLSNHSNVLYHQGQLQTVESLIDLISMSSTNLDYFLEELVEYVGEVGMKAVQRIKFRDKLMEIGRGARKVRRV